MLIKGSDEKEIFIDNSWNTSSFNISYFCYIFKKINDSNKITEYLYKIHYLDNDISEYDIYIYDNYDITVISQLKCDTINCSSDIVEQEDKQNTSFSDENKQVIKKFFDDLFFNKNNNELELSASNLSDDELVIIKSIINNDEQYLKKLNSNVLSAYVKNNYVKLAEIYDYDNTMYNIDIGEYVLTDNYMFMVVYNDLFNESKIPTTTDMAIRIEEVFDKIWNASGILDNNQEFRYIEINRIDDRSIELFKKKNR